MAGDRIGVEADVTHFGVQTGVGLHSLSAFYPKRAWRTQTADVDSDGRLGMKVVA